ncbi:MAG TPA: IS66 family transposase [Casimicrobiaceae bacterium]|nr:IS66 family transposase [Casimicrobiaceae bacterium]
MAADPLPDDNNALKAALIETRAKLSGAEALIEHLQLLIAKMKRELFGPRSERSQRLIDQLELQLEELAAAAGEDEAKAETPSIPVHGFTRRKTRRNFPDHLPRRRIVHAAPASCPCCGGTKLSKIGEDVTETLDVVPRQLFVTEHVREKFSCRSCDKIAQPPAPFHAIARGYAGPSLLAMILVDKYADHQPLNRQSEQFAREGVELSISTMADHVGACAATLLPLAELIKAHVFAAARIHGDETTVPVLAKVKTKTGRLWTYVRDDRPFGGADPPAAVYFYSPDRGGAHPEQHLAGYSGILQADAYNGFNALYEATRMPGPITEAACWPHARRKFFELADVTSKARNKTSAVISPIAFAAVQKFDAIFALERGINGQSSDQRLAARRRDVAPLVNELIAWMKQERAKLSRHNDVAKAFDYMLKRNDAFTRFLADGRICLSNNAAERALRGIALGRKAWLFCGSDRGGERAAVMLTLIQTAKLNDIDPQAWLSDVLARIADHKINDLAALLPWNWRRARIDRAA